ncbi:MAG: hypothetical protein KGD60_04020 [Candidatus Thorarchaeota archaeon]|nr:hypothetical protein [Candidatus Thorarchaeota archaeon]
MTKLQKSDCYTSLTCHISIGLPNLGSSTTLNHGTCPSFSKGVHIIRKSYWFPAVFIILLSFSLVTFSIESVAAEGEIVIIRGDTITITVTLLQNGTYGDPVPNQRIFFFDQTFNTPLGSEKTDTSGIASISWDIPLDYALGLTTINATFYGNDSLSLAPSCQWTTLTVLSSTNIEINQAPDLLAPGDILSFSVHLTDDLLNPLSNAAIRVFKDITPLAAYTTNSSGFIHFDIECNSSWITLGDNDIRVVYEQDLVNYLDTSEYVFTVEISKIPTFLTIQGPFPNEISLNEFVDLYVGLSEINNSLPNEPLEVFLDGLPLFFSTSNSSGIAQFHMNIDERFSLGSHTLRINYNGTDRYSDSFFVIFLDVTSPAQIIVRLPESAEIGADVEIEITASDLLGRAIPNSLISIFDSTSNQRFTISSSPTEISIIFYYELQGPAGIHSLNIEITENSFITNTSSSSSFTAWSNPEILLVDFNVEHYASPDQDVVFEIQMNDWAGNCSVKLLQLLIDDIIQSSVVTDTNGRATLSFSAPHTENQYNISIFYSGNTTLFELPTKLDYSLQVTRLMPIMLELDFYETVAPLHELSVHITVRAFNGSTPKSVQVNFGWLDSNINTESTEEGIIVLHLRVPATSGNYVLYYESETSSSVSSTSGSFIINITMSEIVSLEGVGIAGLAIALIASVGITTVPIIRRRYLVG